MAINQLTTSNTFSQWLTATQSLIETANTLTDGKGATFTANTKLEVAGTGSLLNVRTSGAINQLYSNSATIANIVSSNIVTSTVNVSNTIVFSDNTTINSNSFIIRTFALANSAAEYANAAFIAANTGSAVISAGLYANNAFSTANDAFIQANTPSHVANSASEYANGAFKVANTTTTVGLYANSAFEVANAGLLKANSGFTIANSALVRASNSLDANNGGTVTGTITISTGASGTSLSASANIVAPLFVGTATSARYADLAEKYLTDVEYPVGTLMAIGGTKEVTAAIVSQRPIGVISASPAYMMNSDLEGGTYVALKGRVPIRVVGFVSKGFPLVVSAIAGVAQQGTWNDDYFAIALEASNDYNERLIEGVIL